MWKLILVVIIINAGLPERSYERSHTLHAIDIMSAKVTSEVVIAYDTSKYTVVWIDLVKSSGDLGYARTQCVGS